MKCNLTTNDWLFLLIVLLLLGLILLDLSPI